MKYYVLLMAIAGICILFSSCCKAQITYKDTSNTAPQSIDLGKVLIVYYSKSGKTKEVAEIIQKCTNGTLYRIETQKKYSEISIMIALDAKKELESGNLPELSTAAPDVSAYDLIIVGSPTWRYTVATPVLSFLAQCNFGGKRVAAYATNTGNVGTFFDLFQQRAQNAVLLTGEEFHNKLSSKTELNKKIENWLNNMILKFEE
ncbi:hypothetical protein EZS27_012836 [termite gut metagenome]|jgi:flavodoxin|uniref:Flavodoxin-like domain-containing protein n=1 Tax=termite gut metagenome TaxID=433724 RepID=A0A5J4S1Y0_9ZZZZ